MRFAFAFIFSRFLHQFRSFPPLFFSFSKCICDHLFDANIKATTEKALYKVEHKILAKMAKQKTIWDVVEFIREIRLKTKRNEAKRKDLYKKENKKKNTHKNPILCTENCLTKSSKSFINGFCCVV